MKHVVALSGGKDSTAMALRLAEVEPQDYTYVCTPTGDEPPEMFAHWRKMGDLLGKPILPIVGGTLQGLIKRQNALPNWGDSVGVPECSRSSRMLRGSRIRANVRHTSACEPTSRTGKAATMPTSPESSCGSRCVSGDGSCAT